MCYVSTGRQELEASHRCLMMIREEQFFFFRAAKVYSGYLHYVN